MNKEETIKIQQELIEVLYSQVVDLTMMSKIELGDDVIAEISRLKVLLLQNKQYYYFMKYKIVKFFEVRIGWFFINGRKLETWNKYLREKYFTGKN